MMKQLLVMFMLLCSTAVFAQDVIVKKDGSTILAKVLEVNTKDIKYKKHSNLSGPTYTINKSEIMSINYENGEKDTFYNNDTNKIQVEQTPKNADALFPIRPLLAKEGSAGSNENLIRKYNAEIHQSETIKIQNAPYCHVYFGVTKNSTLANKDLEISFLMSDKIFSEDFDIIIKNKSERIIYIDKGNCYRVINEKEPYCYYNAAEQTTVGRSSDAGASVGLGSIAGVLGVGGVAGQLANGISVGGGASSTSSTTYIGQRVIAIPPRSERKLCENKVIKVSRNWSKTIDPNEDFRTYHHGNRTDGSWDYCKVHPEAAQFGLYKGDVKVNQVLTYREDNTPYRREYTLTYSLDEKFETYSTINFKLFVHQVIGCKYWSSGVIIGELYCSYANLDKR